MKIRIFVHRLGNLLLLPPGLNSGLRDTLPGQKVAAYRKTGLYIVDEVIEMIEAPPDPGQWTTQKIEAREARLLDWVKENWS